MNSQVFSWFDKGIVLIYLVGVVGMGCLAGAHRKKTTGEGSHYFLAGNTLRWPVIGLAMFAANISTVHLVSFAETSYKFGMVYGNFEWMAGFTLILLSLFFAPLYLRSRVATLPDFLERRYNRHCRDCLTVVSLFSAIVIHIGVALYTAALVLRGILELKPTDTILGIDAMMFFIVVLGVLTGIYTMLGGLLAVVWTESVQTVLLLVGAVCITVAAWCYVGGWEGTKATLASHEHPLAKANEDVQCDWPTNNFLSVVRGPSDKSEQPWLGILLGYPIIGIWYWCCDQTIVQRVLAAKDERHARLGPLFCAFLKILPVFLFVLPGVMCVALVQQKHPVLLGHAPASAEDAYTFMIKHLLPWGLKGLVTAAMLAAAMQTCSAALNSTATLFAYDIVKRYRPRTSDHQLVFVGKITTVVGTILAIVASPIFGQKLGANATVFQVLTDLICSISGPITAVFLVGVFWKRATGRAAFITMTGGTVLGLFMFAIDFFKKLAHYQFHKGLRTLDWFEGRLNWYEPPMGWYKILNNWHQSLFGIQITSMFMSFYVFVLCIVTMVVVSCLFPAELKPEAKALVWDNWREPLRRTMAGRWLGDYRVMSAIVFATFIALYIITSWLAR